MGGLVGLAKLLELAPAEHGQRCEPARSRGLELGPFAAADGRHPTEEDVAHAVAFFLESSAPSMDRSCSLRRSYPESFPMNEAVLVTGVTRGIGRAISNTSRARISVVGTTSNPIPAGRPL
jgi:NAD(P)-dependent dehydrogenase (short-subunit alcohol dehydrogenase family)